MCNEPGSNRRGFLKLLGGIGAGAAVSGPLLRALAGPSIDAKDEFFIFIHAQGGWDVTLSLDPRNAPKGLVDPASTKNIDYAALTRWTSDTAPIDTDEYSFKLVQPAGSSIAFGPAIGDLANHYDRLTVVNGLAVNTVSHPDGTVFAATGRHLAGGRVPASSVDTMLSNELGTGQLFPTVSIRFPSSFVGSSLDRRAMPLVVDSIGSMGRAMARSNKFELAADRAQVTAILSDEATDLAKRAADPSAWNGFALQYQSLQKMLGGKIQDLFDATKLKGLQPSFDYAAQYMGGFAVNAAFAIEAMKQTLVRSVSFAMGSFDTHGQDYTDQGQKQQEMFNTIARMIEVMDATKHPTRPSDRLSDHVHILVVSEFCRTPQINLGGGRDHYPNGSALVISPRFKSNAVFGASDPDQLLPKATRKFTDGDRAMAPPDLLATFLSAFGVDPRKYMRDGEVVPEMLRS